MQYDPIDILRAIRYIDPNAEATIISDDFDSLTWVKIKGTPPTNEEIIAAIPLAQKAEKDAEEMAKNKKLSAISKLKALGLDEAEVAALLG